jgi:hypothetical protein
MHEFGLINEITKGLDNFYNDETFTIYDIITFFYNGKENTFINDILLEKFCIKYNINITYNEMKLLLFYLKADSENIITYNQLKKLFVTFVLDKTSSDCERSNIFFNQTLQNYTYFSLNKINNYQFDNNYNEKHEINLINFIKEFIKLEYLLFTKRKQLYLCEDFIPIELFYLFDNKNNNKFNIPEFKTALSVYFSIDSTIEEDEIIFYNYCNYKKDDNTFRNKNCSMDYDSFKKLIIPFDLINLPEKSIQPDKNTISNKTKSIIINFFQTLFFVEKQIDYLKMNYFYKRDFSPYEEFIQLRGNNKKANHITKIMLASFLDNYLENGEKKELLLKSKFEPFFNRFDKDGDLLISYTDFIQSIEPYCTNV